MTPLSRRHRRRIAGFGAHPEIQIGIALVAFSIAVGLPYCKKLLASGAPPARCLSFLAFYVLTALLFAVLIRLDLDADYPRDGWLRCSLKVIGTGLAMLCGLVVGGAFLPALCAAGALLYHGFAYLHGLLPPL